MMPTLLPLLLMQVRAMLRRHHSVSLNRTATQGRALGFDGGNDVDPNSSLTNIADCMLVLMLGFFIALIARYNIDLMPQEDEVVGVEVNMDANGDGVIDDNYTSAGNVYYDSVTGNYYMVEQ